MTDSAPPGWVYNETVRMFALPGDPPSRTEATCPRLGRGLGRGQ